MTGRIVALSLGLALILGSLWLITRQKIPTNPEEQLVKDASSPYAWCDLAEDRAKQGDTAKAAYCFRRAIELGPKIPPVWMRAANFYLAQDDKPPMLDALGHVLSLTGDYDALIFTYFDRGAQNAAEVLPYLKNDPRGAKTYFRYLLDKRPGGSPDQAAVWGWLGANHYTDDLLASDYAAYLARNHLAEKAQAVWALYLGPARAHGYPDSNHLFNGDFETEFTPTDFDWKAQAVDGAESTRDDSVAKNGRWSAKVQFAGSHNVDYAHLWQVTVLRPGNYQLHGWLKTERITTDQGIRVHMYDTEDPRKLDISTEPAKGTTDWTEFSKNFVVSGPSHLIRVELRREASLRFDNKISGSAWLDSVSLIPLR